MQQKQYDYFLDCLQQKAKEIYFRHSFNLKNYTNPLDIQSIDEILNVYELKEFYNNLIIEYSELNSKILNTLNSKSNKDVFVVLDMLIKESQNSYLVGGCIRDILLCETPKDFDFVTDIPYDKLREIFSSNEFKFKETGKEFLVFNVNYNGVDYEIANFRYEEKYLDGRRPSEVRVGTIEEDRQRRDFHINSIMWNPTKLYIHKNAVEDIKLRRLKFIGKPDDRLAEDYLRGIRFYRLVKTKNLIPDEQSLRAVRRNFDKIMNVTPHRMMMEIERICL